MTIVMINDHSKDALVIQSILTLYTELGWQIANCFHEKFGKKGTLGREASSEVIPMHPLQAAPEPRPATWENIEALVLDNNSGGA